MQYDSIHKNLQNQVLVITTVADELKVGSLRLTDTTVRVTPFSTGNILLSSCVAKDGLHKLRQYLLH